MRLTLTLRELFLVILFVATVSLFLNIQANNYGILINSRKIVFASNVSYDAIEESILRPGSFKVVGGRSLSQHEQEVSSQLEGQDNKNLLQRLKEIEKRLLEISRYPVVALVNEDADKNVVQKLKIQNVVIETKNKTDHLNWIDEHTVAQKGNWSVLLCTSSNLCPGVSSEGYKKVNSIRAIKEYINNPDKVCELSKRMDEKFQDLDCDKKELNEEHIEILSTETNRNLEQTSLERAGPVRDSNLFPLSLSPYGPLVRLRLLVTSMIPLRFYMHSSIFFRGNDTFTFHKISLEEIFQYISETYGLGTSSTWWSTLQTILVKFLTQIVNKDTYIQCIRCFMELFADVECISIEHCRLTKLSYTESVPSPDKLSILSFNPSTLVDIVKAMQNIQNFDYTDEPFYLSDADLVYIIDNRVEQMATGNFIKIYPLKNGHELFGHITNLDTALRRVHSGLSNQILSNIEQNLLLMDSDYRNPVDVPYDEDTGMQNVQQQKDVQSNINNMCSEDPDTYKNIDTIYSTPELSFTETKPNRLYSEVTYNTIIIRVGATARNCRCVVKLNNKYNKSGARNISIGLGNNTFHLLVIDQTYSDPKIVNTISVTIFRHSRGNVLTAGRNYRMCDLKQDCSLPFESDIQCGLSETKKRHASSERCISGDQHGRWIVPCSSCHQPDKCSWGDAKWQPYTCTYTSHTKQSLKKCLKDKKLLFIGDSTNRGIMNYMMEQINGTLRHWDKVHNTRIYTNLNNQTTQFTFAYYPHFWLPTDHRPKFQKIIYQLIKSSLPLHNDASTVFIVGGVQWLAKGHIDSIIEALKRKGLLDITVVIKGLGAGFHQSVEGVRFVSKEQQYLLQQKENQILTYAKEKGFRVVSTFNMTMARYRDFMEGTCACHFHKVTKLVNTSEEGDVETRYSVTGDVNSAYSNIVINQICG